MVRRVRRWSLVALLCAILIGGSFSEDNFGLTQTLSAPKPSYFYDEDGWTDIGSTEETEFKLPYPSDTIIIALTTLCAIFLARPHLTPAKRKHASIVLHMGTAEGASLADPPWKTRFKKLKSYDTSGIQPKRHVRLGT